MSTMIDAMILVLLAGTLAYAFLLDRRVRALMSVLRDLEPLVGQFSSAVDKSEVSVSRLRAVSQDMGRDEGRAAPAATDEGPAAVEAASGASTDAAPAPIASFTSTRRAGVARVSGKADLVRSFFEASRDRQA